MMAKDQHETTVMTLQISNPNRGLAQDFHRLNKGAARVSLEDFLILLQVYHEVGYTWRHGVSKGYTPCQQLDRQILGFLRHRVLGKDEAWQVCNEGWVRVPVVCS